MPIPAAGAVYYEVSPLVELRRTLGILSTSLVVASVITTLLGATAGLIVAHRLLRPLRRISDASVDIADGELTRRLDAEGDADLEPLVDSFNQMADAIQLRIEREARFASDVSHELRTPLTALATAIEVVKSRKNEMPERAGMAVDLLGAQVDYFERLVLDLLEISPAGCWRRADQRRGRGRLDVLDRVHTFAEGPTVTLESDGPWEVALDKRRAERVMSDLFENADRYAGGVTYLGLAALRRRIRHHGRRQRPGHPRGGSGSDLRALLAGGHGAPAHEQWHRSRALARVGARPAARSLDPTRYCSDRRCPLRGRAPCGAVAIMRRRAVVAALVVGVAAWGCAVPTQHDATRIDDGQVPFDLLEGSASVPVSSTSSPTPPAALTTVYFVRDEHLAGATRSVSAADPASVLAALVGGPTAEEEQSGLRSALVSDEVVNSANRLGSTVAIDLAGPFTDATASEQRLALAQLTYAMTEIPGIDAVTFTLDGEPTSMLRADGSASDGPLHRADYQLLGPP